jgi:hypothetical protein
MHTALKILAVFVVGTALGLLATWFTVVRGNMPGGVSDGVWKTNLTIGNAQSDPYTRAAVALHGLFALNRQETLYYTATEDSDGSALDGNCRYEIAGRDPSTRWWSITAYGADDFLIPNAAHHYSVSMNTISRDASGAYAVQVGGAGSGPNWIPLAPGHISLTLRLYNPGPDVALDPEHAVLPSLKKASCS